MRNNLLIICFLLLASLGSNASFNEENRRYLSPIDIQIKLNHFFPYREFSPINDSLYTFYSDSVSLICLDFDQYSNPSINFGANLPSTGYPASQYPNTTFVSKYLACVAHLLKGDLGVFSGLLNSTDNLNDKRALLSVLTDYLPEKVIEKISINLSPELPVTSETTEKILNFRTLDIVGEDISLITEWLVFRFLGPSEVIKSYGLSSSSKEVVLWAQGNALNNIEIHNDGTKDYVFIYDYLEQVIFLLVMREEFLAY